MNKKDKLSLEALMLAAGVAALPVTFLSGEVFAAPPKPGKRVVETRKKLSDDTKTQPYICVQGTDLNDVCLDIPAEQGTSKTVHPEECGNEAFKAKYNTNQPAVCLTPDAAKSAGLNRDDGKTQREYANNVGCHVKEELCYILTPQAVVTIGNQNPDGDLDHDGILNREDNCVAIYNPIPAGGDKQADQDDNGIGDACDMTDLDGDGILNFNDNCPAIPNRNQEDWDKNGVGDACDVPEIPEPLKDLLYNHLILSTGLMHTGKGLDIAVDGMYTLDLTNILAIGPHVGYRANFGNQCDTDRVTTETRLASDPSILEVNIQNSEKCYGTHEAQLGAYGELTLAGAGLENGIRIRIGGGVDLVIRDLSQGKGMMGYFEREGELLASHGEGEATLPGKNSTHIGMSATGRLDLTYNLDGVEYGVHVSLAKDSLENGLSVGGGLNMRINYERGSEE